VLRTLKRKGETTYYYVFSTMYWAEECKAFTCIVLIFMTNPLKQNHHFSHFTEEKMHSKRLGWPKLHSLNDRM
jgi:hypothetical protein